MYDVQNVHEMACKNKADACRAHHMLTKMPDADWLTDQISSIMVASGRKRKRQEGHAEEDDD